MGNNGEQYWNNGELWGNFGDQWGTVREQLRDTWNIGVQRTTENNEGTREQWGTIENNKGIMGNNGEQWGNLGGQWGIKGEQMREQWKATWNNGKLYGTMRNNKMNYEISKSRILSTGQPGCTCMLQT